jgi:4-diphosphocytidyl-2-C-methyl-D-erythritol kinase
MKTYPNCKINLGLHVVGKRPDGYHNLETIFLPVTDLCDELEITEQSPTSGGAAHAPSMIQDGITLDNVPEDNLCMKAWRLLHEEFGIPAVHIRLKKGIPFGAGLGGGSSDAAFTLKMLNEMFSLHLNDTDLERRAAMLGADCAFFIQNRAAYASGIGDQLEPLEWKMESGKWKVETGG